MTRRFNPVSFSCFTALCSVALLAGCSSGTTYGTGKSQEAQLLEDLGSITALGTGKKKERIAYASRPGLVAPASKDVLPTPVNSDETAAGYFPVNPEEARAARLNNAPTADERSGDVPLSELRRRKTGAARIVSGGKAGQFYDRDLPVAEQMRQERISRKERLKRLAETRGVSGSAPRRYLTEPPREYRTTAETAAVGQVGEEEFKPGVKRKVSVWDRLTKNKKTSRDGT